MLLRSVNSAALAVRRLRPNICPTRACIHHANIGEIDSDLRGDVKKLGNALGVAIKQNDPKVFRIVEDLRALGREWRLPNGRAYALDDMVAKVESCDANELYKVSRSFANFLALANTAENHHRIRRLRASIASSDSDYGLWPKKDSCGGGIHGLIVDQKIDPSKIVSALHQQTVEIVLTAHPTEVNRRTMLKKLHRIKHILEASERADITKYEQKQLDAQLTAEVTSFWGSDFLRRSKPTPVQEAKSGLAVVESVLWNAIPQYLRKLDDVSRAELKVPLPLGATPIKMATWMGGDRDGNPNVTPEVTLEVAMLSRWTAANLFKADINRLKDCLSVDYCSEELKSVTGGRREPYREILNSLEARLNATAEWAEAYVNTPSSAHSTHRLPKTATSNTPHAPPALRLRASRDLLEPLMLMHRSLMQTGLAALAEGELSDIIRRVAIFGLSLMPMDIRQESTRHTEALDGITKFLGVGSYSSWDESQRREWLLKELASQRPLMPKNFQYDQHPDLFSATAVDTLRTFEVIASLDESSLGAYVISQCQQASDILAVMLLQQDAGVASALRVVPLFETLDDLLRSEATVEALFSMPLYREKIQGKQEIMVGYSDSAKDAGRLAASWAQYNAQVRMVNVAARHSIDLTFFHGKGGTVGRGGNPALFDAILAHPPNTVHGRFRVTEQGEMITQNLGEESVAERTLDLFTTGVLVEGFTPRPEVKPSWAAAMDRLSVVSCDAYRSIVREDPRFVPYFRTTTPELELAGLNVGSRPGKRNPKGGVESLRAIPWVFAWTQTRLNLPTWLGVGEALSKELQSDPALVKEMYNDWPWFRTFVDLLEMVLVKSDSAIAANYDTQLVADAESLELGKELRAKLEETADALLQISGHPTLQSHNAVLLNSLAVRNPYVDPLNVIQAELLKRLRQTSEDGGGGWKYSEEERALLQDALLITINGIANGMRNSG